MPQAALEGQVHFSGAGMRQRVGHGDSRRGQERRWLGVAKVMEHDEDGHVGLAGDAASGASGLCRPADLRVGWRVEPSAGVRGAGCGPGTKVFLKHLEEREGARRGRGQQGEGEFWPKMAIVAA